ncbi:cysteine desulfurase family protein [Methylomonas sp. AM2-LC]|uniref:cysteine desulfurase family protein n=1 Tax=Methylomonas sp. AM2-LC TaxID=3153301 RepID=UPI0032678653
MIYFDHNSTTPIDDRVLAAMLPYLQTFYGNPSSLHKQGRIARTAVDIAREQIAALVDAKPEQIIFTSGGSEANTLAFANAGQNSIYISAIEHPSVFETSQALANPLIVLPIEESGQITLATLKKSEPKPGDFVSIMLANNETGALQNIADFAEYLNEREIKFHTDAVQALGKIPVSFQKLGVQLMSLSSHKINGPKGCGALVFNTALNLNPWQRGGNQEHGLRAGTENVAAIVGFGKAAELAKLELEQSMINMQQLRSRLEQQLLEIPNLVIFAQQTPRLANTLQFGISGYQGDMLLMQLDRHSIAVSSGSACSATSTEPSPVLQAMGIDPQLAKSAIRISLGKNNNEQEVDQFVQVLKTLVKTH